MLGRGSKRERERERGRERVHVRVEEMYNVTEAVDAD